MKPADLVAPRAPASLSAAAKAEWNELAPLAWNLGTLRAETMCGFAMLCIALAEEKTARLMIETDGALIGEAKKAHPALKIAAEARRVVIKLLAEFRLLPGDRVFPIMSAAPAGGEEALEAVSEALVDHCFRQKSRKER